MNRQFELERMRRLSDDLQKLIVEVSVEISQYSVLEGKEYTEDLSLWEEKNISESWNSVDAHRWFCARIRIPDEMQSKKVVFSIVTGREGQWDATNPQMLLYLDGKLIQGADVNHRELLLTECAKKGEEHEIRILAYSGLLPGELLIHTYLQAIDEKVYISNGLKSLGFFSLVGGVLWASSCSFSSIRQKIRESPEISFWKALASFSVIQPQRI